VLVATAPNAGCERVIGRRVLATHVLPRPAHAGYRSSLINRDRAKGPRYMKRCDNCLEGERRPRPLWPHSVKQEVVVRRSICALLALALLATACSGPSASQAPAPVVSTKTTTGNTSVVTVGASNYQVIVTTSGPAWVQSSYPVPNVNAAPSGSEGLIPAAQTRSYSPVLGKLALQVGSVQLQVEVQVDGRTVSGGRIVPPKAPYTWYFSSVA
jgi:hypothetical protein